MVESKNNEVSKLWQLEHPKETSDARKKYYYANKHKKIAKDIVYKAIHRSRTLIKKPCEVCGCIKSIAHHNDYTKPLEVVFLCDLHHKQLHIQLRKLKAQF